MRCFGTFSPIHKDDISSKFFRGFEQKFAEISIIVCLLTYKEITADFGQKIGPNPAKKAAILTPSRRLP